MADPKPVAVPRCLFARHEVITAPSSVTACFVFHERKATREDPFHGGLLLYEGEKNAHLHAALYKIFSDVIAFAFDFRGNNHLQVELYIENDCVVSR